jgi:cephalosporin-C deacetylase
MPTQFDMPFDKLVAYQGTNPRPHDFDAYWAAAVAEMEAVDPQIEIVTDTEFVAPYARCAHLWFTGVGGARIHAKLLQPLQPPAQSGPALLMFHGYSGSCGGWIDKLPYVAAGFTVAALDCRGQGGLSEDVGGVKGNTLRGHFIRGLDDAPEKLLFRSIFLDTAQLAKIVGSLDGVDRTRIGTLGGSQGGALALACAALAPQHIAKVCTVHPFLCDYRRVYDIDLAKDAYAELHDFFRRFDPQHRREDEIFARLGYIDVQHLAPRIRADVLMGITLADRICPPSSQFAAYNKIVAPKSVELYHDFAHEPPPGFAELAFRFLLELR